MAKVFMKQEEWKDISRKMYEIEEKQWEIKYNKDTAKQMAIAADFEKVYTVGSGKIIKFSIKS